jgi:phosphoribulokinase
MSAKFPIIAITGSSGAGTTTVEDLQEDLQREKVTAAFIEGDAFHRYDRAGDEGQGRRGKGGGPTTSPISAPKPTSWKSSKRVRGVWPAGKGKTRHYVHDDEEAERYGARRHFHRLGRIRRQRRAVL